MKELQLALLLLIPVVSLAETPVVYRVSFENAVHHEAQISVTYADIGDQALELRMSRSSPGRYALHEFAKNVYQVEAVDGQGKSLPISRPNPYQWDVAGHDGTVTVSYTLYADRADGTYSAIDLTHAHLNMPATLMWARGFDQRPAVVTFAPSDPGWKIATQLVQTDDALTYTAPNLQYLLDSPTELSDFSERSWQVESDGEQYTIRLVIHHDGTEDDVDEFTEMARRIVDTQIEIFGETPDYDYGRYTFIADYLPHVSGDGMEHRNSTIVTSSRSLIEADFDQIGTIAHEFMHAWNVERIRPATLEPFDYEKVNMSPNLWFAEGFTSYYGELTRRRAHAQTTDEYGEDIAQAINTVTSAPGRAFFSAEGMSMLAPFRDAARSIDPANFANTYISYYTWGHAIALALDLSLRSQFEDVSLDDFMRYVWQQHGRTETPYTTDDLCNALTAVTGNQEFADDFFTRYISGHELADYQSLLANAGMLLRRKNPGDAFLGSVELEFEGKDAYIADNTVIGSPLYEAGLDRGDQIMRVGRLKIRNQKNWDRMLRRYDPGDTATIRFMQRGMERSAKITFIEDPELEVVSYENADENVSEEQLAFRLAWLGPEPDDS